MCANINILTSPEKINIDRIEEVTDQPTQAILMAIEEAYRLLRADITALDKGTNDLQDEIDEGLVADFNIPLMTDIVFSAYLTTGVQWTAGTISYNGVVTDISAGNTTLAHVFIDTSGTPAFGSTDTPSITADRWYVATNISGTVYDAFQSPIIHGGLIQANTVDATAIEADTIFTQDLTVRSTFTIGSVGTPGGEIVTQGKTAIDTTAGVYLGYDSAKSVYGFQVYNDADNYFTYDPSATDVLYIATETGFIGSSTDYFDISNARLQVSDTVVSVDYYCKISTNSINFTNFAFGETTDETYATYDPSGITLFWESGTYFETAQMTIVSGTTTVFQASAGGTTGQLNFQVLPTSGTEEISADESTGSYYVREYELQGCVVDTTTNTTNGALRYTNVGTHTLECYINGSWIDAAREDAWTGSFTNGDGDTVTVTNGIITDVS